MKVRGRLEQFTHFHRTSSNTADTRRLLALFHLLFRRCPTGYLACPRQLTELKERIFNF